MNSVEVARASCPHLPHVARASRPCPAGAYFAGPGWTQARAGGRHTPRGAIAGKQAVWARKRGWKCYPFGRLPEWRNW